MGYKWRFEFRYFRASILEIQIKWGEEFSFAYLHNLAVLRLQCLLVNEFRITHHDDRYRLSLDVLLVELLDLLEGQVIDCLLVVLSRIHLIAHLTP